ncbi:MAG: hypothetical protein AB7S98_10825 [Burkholderiaceae bacterium]
MEHQHADAHHGAGSSSFDDGQPCSSCAPCCVGIALFYDAPRLAALSLPATGFPAADALYRSVWLGHLDRPPSVFFA